MSDTHRFSILVVDDDPVLLAGTTRLLEREGYRVLRAETEAQCLAMVREQRPDLVLLDVTLGVSDGMAICERIKSDPATASTHVILHSATKVSSDAQAEGLTRLADGYVLKTVPPKELVARVRAALRLKAAEDAVRSQREWLWTILAGLDEAVVATDADAIITFANQSAVRLARHAVDEWVGRPLAEVLDLSGCEIGGKAGLVGQVARTGTPRPIADCQLLPRGGRPIPVSGSVNPLREAGGSIQGVVLLLRDMTEAVRAQEILVESGRLQVSRGIAAGMAHTINNLLAVISGNAEMLSIRLRADAGTELRDIRESVRRAADLTSRLLSFTGQDVRVESGVDVVDLLRRAVELSGPYPPGVEVEADLPADPCAVRGDASGLSVAFVSIITNARESISGTGRIVVALHRLPGGASFQATVSDDGCGMGPAIRSRLFEPFFSTKFLGRGLGLPSARGIMVSHGGRIDVQSEEGAGTTVTVTLPAAPGRSAST